jgi:hypothetical protein
MITCDRGTEYHANPTVLKGEPNSNGAIDEKI